MNPHAHKRSQPAKNTLPHNGSFISHISPLGAYMRVIVQIIGEKRTNNLNIICMLSILTQKSPQ